MALEYPFELPATLFHSIGMPIDTQIDTTTLSNFGKTLIIVAAADGRFSVWERGWLTAYMSAYGASKSLLDELDNFDFHNADLDTYLYPLLEGEYAKWVRRSLLQGAIRMSRADTLTPEEYAAVKHIAELLGMPESVVNEIRSLVEVFDSVASTNTLLLSIAQKEDAEDNLASTLPPEPEDSWDSGSSDNSTIYSGIPGQGIFEESINTFAKAVLHVARADGDVTEPELTYLTVYLHSWGATDEQIQAIHQFDYKNVTAGDIVGTSTGLHWGLKALTSIALRMAGSDGLHPKEEEAILELYRLSGHSVMLYYAIRGLEEIRSLALNRLNEIFKLYIL